MQGQRPESSAHLIMLHFPPCPPSLTFLSLTRCTKDNNIRQTIFLLIGGQMKPDASSLHHPTAGGQHQQYHHRPHDTQYLCFTKGCMQECVWPSQTHSDPKGAHLLPSLTLENNCIQWAASFPQVSLPQSPQPPNSISNRGLGLIRLVKNQNQPLGLEQN